MKLISTFLLTCLVFVECGQPKQSEQPSDATTDPALSTSASQDSAARIETFLKKRGELFIREFHPVGIIKGLYGNEVKITALVVSTPNKKTKEFGMRLDFPPRNSYSTDQQAFLDYDELEPLSESIAYMLKRAEELQDSTIDYTEWNYYSRGGTVVGFFQDARNQSFYIQSGSYSLSTTVFGEKKIMVEFALHVKSGRTKLVGYGARDSR